MKKQEILKCIDKILLSNEVSYDTQLKEIFMNGRTLIENDELGAIGRLSNDLSMYLITHHYTAPEKVIEFASLMTKYPHEDRGKGAFLKMVAMSFLGLK